MHSLQLETHLTGNTVVLKAVELNCSHVVLQATLAAGTVPFTVV